MSGYRLYTSIPLDLYTFALPLSRLHMHIDFAAHPQFLTTRETFPGERSFAELSRAFFGARDASSRAAFIADRWKGRGLLVHMANPEQLDDLFAHIDREKSVRFLSTSYIHDDIRPTV